GLRGGGVRIDVADRDHRHLGELREVLEIGVGDHSGSDKADANGLVRHQLLPSKSARVPARPCAMPSKMSPRYSSNSTTSSSVCGAAARTGPHEITPWPAGSWSKRSLLSPPSAAGASLMCSWRTRSLSAVKSAGTSAPPTAAQYASTSRVISAGSCSATISRAVRPSNEFSTSQKWLW